MNPGVLFLNFGGPTQDAELRPFLFELLRDVLPGKGLFNRWLAGRIATSRAEVVRENYRTIGWSPIVSDTVDQARETMRRIAGGEDIPYAAGMMFSEPFISQAIDTLLDQGVDRIVAVSLYPHWSYATTGSAYDMVHQALAQRGKTSLPVHFVPPFFDDPTYLGALADIIRHDAEKVDGEGPLYVLFSAHGVPLSFVKRHDPYPDQVRATVRGVTRLLDYPEDQIVLGWQSRLGPTKWLSPSTETQIKHIAEGGGKSTTCSISRSCPITCAFATASPRSARNATSKGDVTSPSGAPTRPSDATRNGSPPRRRCNVNR